MKRTFCVVWVFGILVGILVVNSDYTTEQVCFDTEGRVIAYASKFDPKDKPYIKLVEGLYKNVESGALLTGVCKMHWSPSKPKGIDYWTVK